MEEVQLGDITESPTSYANTIRHALTLSGSSKILLAVAWTSDELRRFAEMYPEVTSTDITEKTCAERRPLILDAGSDSENRNFTSCFAFLPSKARWTVDWYFSVAKPALLSKRAIAGNRVCLSDEDPLQYNSFVSHSIGIDSLYQHSQLRLCAWHKINRNLRKSLTSALEKLGPRGKKGV